MRAEPRQEYEALYDVPKTAFSAAHAAEIEASSWTTTDRLISAFGEETMREPISETITTATIPEPVSEPAVTEIAPNDAAAAADKYYFSGEPFLQKGFPRTPF